MSDCEETIDGSPHFVSFQKKLTTSLTRLQNNAEEEHNGETLLMMNGFTECPLPKSINWRWMLCLMGWTLEVALGWDLDVLICHVWICRNWIANWCQVCLGWIWEDFQQHSEPLVGNE
jgi:hypothetical protein